MPSLRLLLIEDSQSDRTLFADQIQNELGNDVQIDCAEKIGEAFHLLEHARATRNFYDQIWLDPGLPDLGQQNISSALATLKAHVEPGQLRLLTSNAAPEITRQARKHDVQTVSKSALSPSGDLEVLEIVKELISKRSSGSGATTRVEMARYEAKLANLEYKVDENCKRLEKIEQGIDRMNSLAFELSAIKDLLAKIPTLEQSVKEVKSAQADAKKATDAQWDFRKVVIGGIITAVFGALTTLGPLLIPRLFPEPDKPAPIVNQK